MTRDAAFCLTVVVSLLSLSKPAHAHPYHVSMAECEYNPESGRVEVALRVEPEHLEVALGIHAGRKVNLEKTAKVDELIVAYLEKAIRMTPAVKSRKESKKVPRASLVWVGKEVTPKETWLYFEVPLPGGILGATFENRLFFERSEKQVNTFNLKQGRFKTTLWFTREKPRRVLTARPAS